MKISEKDSHVGLGTPSIILIVVVFAMVIFALLALRSAQAEKKLAAKTAQAVENYYALGTTTEETLALVDNLIKTEQTDKFKKIEAVPFVTKVTPDDNKTCTVEMFVESNDGNTGILTVVRFSEGNKGFDIIERRFVRKEPEGGYELMLPD